MSTRNVERLTRRIAEIPASFQAKIDPRKEGGILVEAVIGDLFLAQTGEHLSGEKLDAYRFGKDGKKGVHEDRRKWLRLSMVAAWLLADEAFSGVDASKLERLFTQVLHKLATVVGDRQVIEDPDRREELVRVCMHRLDRPPEGESAADALDRLSSLDSVRRVELLREARVRDEERRKREKELEEQKKKKEAEEQAARYDRDY